MSTVMMLVVAEPGGHSNLEGANPVRERQKRVARVAH